MRCELDAVAADPERMAGASMAARLAARPAQRCRSTVLRVLFDELELDDDVTFADLLRLN